ncbi:MAG: S-methyl-5-thioribose-1-phosphate isomerase, partial [Dehalococcoidia bacterium]
MKTIEWVSGKIRLIDQTRLPWEMVFLELDDYREVASAIREMQIRGAPAIGIAAA